MRFLLLTICFFTGIIANAQETKTSMGFSLSPSFSSVRYVDDGSYPTGYIDLIESHTTGSIGLSGNVFFQYEASEKFLITWGLGVQNYRYRTTYFSETQIDHPTIKRTTTYSQYYLGLNANIKYRIYKMFYARVGVGADVIVEPRIKIKESCPSCEYSFKGNDYASDFKEVIVPVSLGVGHELKLTDRLNLMTELFGTMVVTDALHIVANSSVLQRKPWKLGFSIGVIRSF